MDDQNRRKHAFLKNKAGELLKIKDLPKKQTENKAETKLAMSLKTIEGPKKQSENKPENKAGHLVENTRSPRNKPETNVSVATGAVMASARCLALVVLQVLAPLAASLTAFAYPAGLSRPPLLP